MKKLNESPELIIVAFGLICAAVFMAAELFYSPPLSTTKVIYSDKSTAQARSVTDETAFEQGTRDNQPQKNAGISGTEAAADSKQTAPAENSSGKININTAGIDTLCTLQGIGEVKAQRIIDYRNANGGFKSIEEIKSVSGIGDKTYENIKDRITV